MKKRTAFETTLVRRIAKKNDYLRYAAYEMSLEALRKKRVERLSTLSRTIFNILDHDFFLACRTTAHEPIRVGLRSRTKAIPHLRARTQKVQIRHRIVDTIYPACKERRR